MALATPFMILVPAAFVVAFVLGGTDLRWSAIAAGAAGWLAALPLLHRRLRVKPRVFDRDRRLQGETRLVRRQMFCPILPGKL